MASKKEQIAQEVARAVGAGKAAALETVDFSDPNRPKTCLEVDFPILPVNQVAIIEGNAGKPIYQMSKWWARRRSSVFRSMLIAAATKAPSDSSHAAKLVWDNYYANHQKKGTFKHLKVADIFMGGGTTLVEGSRLGMQMFGNDLNPVAWFIVKQELAKVDLDEVKRLLADVEAEVKPQIMPYYYCDGPNGEKGTWTDLRTGTVMSASFDPLTISQDERKHYRYEGPEIIYTFWAKHGPCQVTGCGHRTPIMTSPVMAVKTLIVKHWPLICTKCGEDFDVEETAVRMAPDAPLYVAPGERAFSTLDLKRGVVCPHCGHAEMLKLGKPKKPNKKVELSLLVHPQWLAGSAGTDADGRPFGGSAQDTAEATANWDRERAGKIRLLEVRGTLPEVVRCPETGVEISTGAAGGTIAKKAAFACALCGTVQDVLASMTANGHRAPMSAYAVQAISPKLKVSGACYGGRFFAAAKDSRQMEAAGKEWELRRAADLTAYWPRTALPEGFKTTYQRIPEHGYRTFADMFNPRQLLVQTQLLRAILTVAPDAYSDKTREYVLAAFQQYLRNQNMLCLWNTQADKLEPHFSNNNYYPKNTPVENCVFGSLGRGNWTSCAEGLLESAEWALDPWELVSNDRLGVEHANLKTQITGKSEKVRPNDKLLGASVICGSSTELTEYKTDSFDLVITDPPFGNNVQYAELADFFHVWLRLALQRRYLPFESELSPKALEAVDNPVRNPDDPQGYYQQLLTAAWKECARILKPGGILAFTFHHSEDAPWVSVLESLFDAGFYLEAAYPIRSDETKGEGSKPGTFGSQQIEYDIIHVCRKRTEAPTPVSWGRMRREVLADVNQLQGTLENHAKQGLPAADLQVIRRGKALEYFSRHYGKVYVDAGRSISVKEALVGINQLIDEDGSRSQEPPPVSAEPISRQFLRMFDGKTFVARDQMQKHLRGSGIAPDEFVSRGWCSEQRKVFHLTEPMEFAQGWYGKHRRRLAADLDQALVLTGACFDGSGINAADTLRNENFKPHPALKGLLDWLSRHAGTEPLRHAATRALTIYNQWADSNKEVVQQMSLFLEE
jgi:adenine-specific DNA methylase